MLTDTDTSPDTDNETNISEAQVEDAYRILCPQKGEGKLWEIMVKESYYPEWASKVPVIQERNRDEGDQAVKMQGNARIVGLNMSKEIVEVASGLLGLKALKYRDYEIPGGINRVIQGRLQGTLEHMLRLADVIDDNGAEYQNYLCQTHDALSAEMKEALVDITAQTSSFMN